MYIYDQEEGRGRRESLVRKNGKCLPIFGIGTHSRKYVPMWILSPLKRKGRRGPTEKKRASWTRGLWGRVLRYFVSH